eukprot:gene8106-12567_t
MLDISQIQEEINLIPEKQNEKKIITLVENLKKEGYTNLIENWIFADIISSFEQKVFPVFYKNITEENFETSVEIFSKTFEKYQEIVEIIQKVSKNQNLKKKFCVKIQSKIFEKDELLKKFEEIFKIYFQENLLTEEEDSMKKIFIGLKNTGLSLFINDICFNLIIEKLNEKIDEICDLEEEDEYLQLVFNFFEEFISPKISFLFFENSSEIEKNIKIKIYENYAKKRISEIFNIIVDYPDSIAIIKDLKQCLIKKNLTQELIKEIIRSFKKRLLIIGATTSDIIAQYINMIRTLSILDPSEVGLLKINPIMKEYLSKRNDAISCIINDMIDEENESELNQELVNNDYIENESDSENESWEPEAIHSNPLIKSKKGIDIIKKIIEMFGNKELFANEYQEVLGNQLIVRNDLNLSIEDETKTLEFLKLRFGEKNLFNCEVMLKDMTDSKKLNKKIQEKLKNPSGLGLDIELNLEKKIESLIISRIYWPKMEIEEEIQLHPVIESMLEEFHCGYKSFQNPRKLIFFKELGNISLSIEIGSKEFDLNLTPLNASLIMYFCDEETWEIHDLSKKTKIEVDTLQKKLQYWVNKRFLIIHQSEENEEEIYYQLVDEVEDENEIIEDDEDEQEEEAASIEVYETLIEHMLTNFDSMDPEKIHNSLKIIEYFFDSNDNGRKIKQRI